MKFSSVQSLCLHLISSAYQRSRISEQICRLSVILTRSSSSSLRISISDTGIASSLEEFEALRFSSTDDAYNWDGMLSVKTTSINDRENVAIHLVAEDCDVPGSRYEKVFLANECMQLPISGSNIELLKSGLENYVRKHGNNLSNKCQSCFPSWEQLKIGSGVACSTKNLQQTELVMEAVIIISTNVSMDNTACSRRYCDKTEVIYFKDFAPVTISDSFMKALKSTDWKRYGLNLGGIVQQDGSALLEWENLPTDTHIDIVLHLYRTQTVIPAPRKMSRIERGLVKRAVKLSLDDLKEKHSGVLLSNRAVQIRSYAPDLAKTIAGLILSSNDLDFQGECFSLLGLQSKEDGTEIMENCIKERIVSVIEMNDKKDHKTNEVAPLLFEDGHVQEMEFQGNDDCEEGEYDDFSPIDL